MRKIIAIILALIFVLALSGAVEATSVAVNPSSQMYNQGVVSSYIEGNAMRDLGLKVKTEMINRGADSEVFWSGRGDYIDGLVEEVQAANAYGADDFISLHSDAAGTDKSNTLLILYTSVPGRALAENVGKYVAAKMDMRLELRYRPELYVLRQTTMPAILMEVLNHSNTTDCMRLLDNNFRQAMAESIADGYADYKELEGVVVPVPTPVPQTRARIPRVIRQARAMLSIGDEGGQVGKLQVRLQQKGYDLAADGIFGPITKRMVVQFQRDNRLIVDGIVGPQTWASLDKETNKVRIYQTVTYGDKGRTVVILQQHLNSVRQGWGIAVDGIFGPHTDSAVRIYQRQEGLKEDGIVGRNTWTRLTR
jgi:peptidoglycan hydrolase-like protein with peptidoglycan-binding domain